MNTISVILVSGGIIGLFIYIISLFNIYIKADKAQKMIFAVFAVILLVSNNFYKETYMLTLVFMTINNGSDGEIYAR